MSLPAGTGRRIGILGGTFDPVHIGHLKIAAAVQRRFALDSVVFIPAANPPHKAAIAIAPVKDRIAMLQCAIRGQEGFYLSTMEAERVGPSYSVDTLSRLRAALAGDTELFFIVGIDAFEEIATWKEYRHLPDFAHLVVVNRPHHTLEQLNQLILRHFTGFRYNGDSAAWESPLQIGRIYALSTAPVAVSSTRIRQQVRDGEPVGQLVPPCVAQYIADNGLYR